MEWFREIWGNQQVVLYGIVALLTGFVIARIVCDLKFNIGAIPPVLKMYIIYFLYSLFGFFVARDHELFVSSLITYGCFVIVCFDCWYISFKMENNNWLYGIFRLVAVVCALQVILAGQPYYNGIIVTTMSKTNNPNALAFVLVIGILAFAIGMNLKKQSAFFITVIAVAMMLYGIVLTGSRKCLLVAVPIVAFWLFTYVTTMRKEHRHKQLLVSMSVIGVAFAICAGYIRSSFTSSAAFERLMQLFSEGGTDTRESLYRDAFEFFETSPIIGIGFNQYRVWSSYGFYSHSSYAEILSCGGIIGVLIFFVPLLNCMRRYLAQAFQRGWSQQMYRIRMVMLILICELFIGIGQIYIYNILHMVVLMLISFEERMNQRKLTMSELAQ